MLTALLIILPLVLGALLLTAGFVGHTVAARRTFCRSCKYEVASNTIKCPECGSTIVSSSLAIAFSINHPLIAAFKASASQGRHRTSRPLLLFGAMLLTLSAASIVGTVYSNTFTKSWRAFAPSSYLLTTIERAPSLTHANSTVAEIRRRANAGQLSPQLHARFENLINQPTPTPTHQILANPQLPSLNQLPVSIATLAQSIQQGPTINHLATTPLAPARPTRPNSSRITTNTRPLFALPVHQPSIQIVDARPIHTQPAKPSPSAEPDPKLVFASPEQVERMLADRRALNITDKSVLIQHNFEIRTPSFQPFGTIAPLYPGLTTPSPTPQRTHTSKHPSSEYPRAGRKINLKRL